VDFEKVDLVIPGDDREVNTGAAQSEHDRLIQKLLSGERLSSGDRWDSREAFVGIDPEVCTIPPARAGPERMRRGTETEIAGMIPVVAVVMRTEPGPGIVGDLVLLVPFSAQKLHRERIHLRFILQ